MNATPEKSKTVCAIATAWLVVGILDIMSAIAIWLSRGTTLTHGFQAIASGLLGAKSYQGGLATAGLGLAIHFFIAFVVVAIFYLASRKIRFLTERAAVSGVIYGIIVYLVMYWIVLPATFPPFRHRLGNDVLELVIHIVLIGLTTALIIRGFSRPVEEA
jgi:uncharacterized membrane protein YagU involved in acid resistance